MPTHVLAFQPAALKACGNPTATARSPVQLLRLPGQPALRLSAHSVRRLGRLDLRAAALQSAARHAHRQPLELFVGLGRVTSGVERGDGTGSRSPCCPNALLETLNMSEATHFRHQHHGASWVLCPAPAAPPAAHLAGCLAHVGVAVGDEVAHGAAQKEKGMCRGMRSHSVSCSGAKVLMSR